MPVPTTEIYHIVISRTDAIGDVVLTLPMAAYLKELFPGCKVSFLGRDYTAPVIRSCTAVDEFISYDNIKKLGDEDQVKFLKHKQIDTIIHVFPNKHIAALAKQAGIKLRIGTTNRLFHWFTCNKLVKLSRKRSNLHEAQLNLLLLKPLYLNGVQSITDVIAHYQFANPNKMSGALSRHIVADKVNIILHPKSHGSGVEWGLDKFAGLTAMLPPERYNIIITGSEKEKLQLAQWIPTLPAHVIDMTGKMNLTEFISFIFKADGLVASGTGPVHIAAAAGINTLGLYPSARPIHPGRWAPLGKQATYIESNGDTLNNITMAMVAEKINLWKK